MGGTRGASLSATEQGEQGSECCGGCQGQDSPSAQELKWEETPGECGRESASLVPGGDGGRPSGFPCGWRGRWGEVGDFPRRKEGLGRPLEDPGLFLGARQESTGGFSPSEE